MPPLAIAAGIGVAGSIAGGAIGAAGAKSAANTQANAADYAAQLQAQEAQNALNFQEQVYGNQQRNIAPWLQSGTGALGNLDYLLGITPYNSSVATYSGAPASATVPQGTYSGQPASKSVPLSSLGTPPGSSYLTKVGPNGQPIAGAPGLNNPMTGQPRATPQTPTFQASAPGGAQSGAFGSLLQGWNQPFVAPNDVTQQNDPGYKFRLQQGLDALDRSAAARGGVLTGSNEEALNNYAQDYASNEYNNVYNRALGQYQQNYNIFQNNQANQFNRLAALAGIGQTAAGQLGSVGQAAAGNVGNILLTSGGQIGQQLNNAGAATASGYAGTANALGGALGGSANTLSQYLLLNNLLGSGGNQVPPTIGNPGDTAVNALYPGLGQQ